MKSENIATYDTKLQNKVAEMIVQGLNLELGPSTR